MRHLLLTALLAGMPMMAYAADDSAINDLVRRPVNSVDPIDGHQVDTKLQPVTLQDSDGQDVQIGCSSEASQRALRAKFGADVYEAIRAAKANTTIAQLKAASPSPAPATSGLAAAPQASTTSAGSSWNTAPSSSPTYPSTSATSAYHGESTTPGSTWPESTTTSTARTTAATSTGTVKKPKAKSKHHSEESEHISTSNGIVEYTDERQVEKKAAQRRDLGERDYSEGAAETAPVHHKSKHKSSTKTSTGSVVSPGTANEPTDPWAPKGSSNGGTSGTTNGNNPFSPAPTSSGTTGSSYQSPTVNGSNAPSSAPMSPSSSFSNAPAASSTPVTSLPSPAPAPASTTSPNDFSSPTSTTPSAPAAPAPSAPSSP